MRVALYTRVSTADQKPELQLEELRAYAERRRWQVAETYEDVISGAKAKRRGLSRLMEDARLRYFDYACVWKPARFWRLLERTFIAEWTNLGFGTVEEDRKVLP